MAARNANRLSFALMFSTPTNSSRLLLLVFVTALIDMIGFGIIIPILPFFAEHYGANALTIGFLTAVFLLIQFFSAPAWGNLSDRLGRRPVLLICIFATAVSYVIFGMAESLAVLFLARIMGGVFAGKYSTIQAYIADITTPKERSKGMGLFGAAFGLGFILGPVLGGLLGRWSYAAPLYFAAALTTVNGVVAFYLLPESISPETKDRIRRQRDFFSARADSVRAILMDHSIGHSILISGVFNGAFSMLYATFALFNEREFGFHTTETGYLFAYIGMVGAVVQGGMIGRLSRKFGEEALVKAGLAVMTAGMFSLSLADTLTKLVVAGTLMAAGSGLLTPALSGLVSQRTPDSRQGRVLGVMQSAGNLGRMAGMIGGGYVFDAVSIWSPFWISGIILTLATVYSMRTIHPVNAADSLPFAGETHE